jgi:succinoglycan biosynthesis protein ExoL
MNPRTDDRIAFFAHERGDARVAKRIAALGANGWSVLGFTFHRDRGKPDTPPAWENIDLGTTRNREYLRRLVVFAGSLLELWKTRDRLGDCRVIYAINTDNALLALAGRFFAGSKAPLVLELADIQPAMTGSGLVSRLIRFIERRVLSRSRLLVTTSPGFIEHYFKPFQNHEGPVFLLENKIYPSENLPPPGYSPDPVHGGDPWIIGYFGAFRCRRSLELINFLASKQGNRIRFILRGYASGTIAGDFPTLLGNLPNVNFHGPYNYPDDLPTLYGGVDFNWCFDEADPSGNSAWLLPNRIYEGGRFGTPALAAKETATGKWIADHQCGWQFAEPLEESLVHFFESITPASWKSTAEQCRALPPGTFHGEEDYAALSDKLRNLV